MASSDSKVQHIPPYCQREKKDHESSWPCQNTTNSYTSDNPDWIQTGSAFTIHIQSTICINKSDKTLGNVHTMATILSFTHSSAELLLTVCSMRPLLAHVLSVGLVLFPVELHSWLAGLATRVSPAFNQRLVAGYGSDISSAKPLWCAAALMTRAFWFWSRIPASAAAAILLIFHIGGRGDGWRPLMTWCSNHTNNGCVRNKNY